MTKLYRKCRHCKGTGKLKVRQEYQDTPDIKKLIAIMKRNDLNQLSLAKVLGMSQGTINGWLHEHTNPSGTIKKVYFNMLKVLGYK